MHARPLSIFTQQVLLLYPDREKQLKDFRQVLQMQGQTMVLELDGKTDSFTFDNLYDMESTQDMIYQDIGLPLLDRAFEGYNGTIFAYGQTGVLLLLSCFCIQTPLEIGWLSTVHKCAHL